MGHTAERGEDIFEEVFDDGEDISEEVFNDGKDIFSKVFDDAEDICEEVEKVIKERSYLVLKAKEVRIVKEVMGSGGLWRFACGDVLRG